MGLQLYIWGSGRSDQSCSRRSDSQASSPGRYRVPSDEFTAASNGGYFRAANYWFGVPPRKPGDIPGRLGIFPLGVQGVRGEFSKKRKRRPWTRRRIHAPGRPHRPPERDSGPEGAGHRPGRRLVQRHGEGGRTSRQSCTYCQLDVTKTLAQLVQVFLRRVRTCIRNRNRRREGVNSNGQNNLVPSLPPGHTH